MTERQALKRRGLIAGAATLVAGIASKQAAPPVRASTDTNFVAQGGSGTAFTNSSSGYNFGVYATGDLIGVNGTSPTGYGVYGVSNGNHGVVGQTTGPPGHGYVGVYGSGNGSGSAGVLGDGRAASDNTTGHAGVQGISAQFGVIGNVNNAPNTIGVWGNNTSTGAGPIGVRGDCTNGNGVYGQSATGYGVLGYSTGGSASLSGISTNANIPAFAGGNSVNGGLAAAFTGTVYVNGMFVVADMTQKHGLLKHPDGSHRLMYTLEAPESWVEDYGTGTLVNGKVEITLDPDFAALIHTEDYHVFVTSHHEEGNALAVTGRHADRFMVTEKAQGASSGTFSWRVVAKPKSDTKVERLGKFVVPNVPLPDVTKLPKPGEPPTVAVPKKP